MEKAATTVNKHYDDTRAEENETRPRVNSVRVIWRRGSTWFFRFVDSNAPEQTG